MGNNRPLPLLVFTGTRDFIDGAKYLGHGLALIRQPGMRRYAILPSVVSLMIFVLLTAFTVSQFDALMAVLLPDWMGWLEWLLWPLLIAVVALLWVFTYVHITNILAAPFNDLLAEKVLRHARGANQSDPNPDWGRLVQNGLIAVWNTVAVLVYFALWAIPLLLLSLTPGINIITPFLWFLFNVWMLGLEYADYPLGAHGLSFKRQRQLMRDYRALGLGFGSATLLLTSIPLLNLIAMPAAVAGATLMCTSRVLPAGAQNTG